MLKHADKRYEKLQKTTCKHVVTKTQFPLENGRMITNVTIVFLQTIIVVAMVVVFYIAWIEEL